MKNLQRFTIQVFLFMGLMLFSYPLQSACDFPVGDEPATQQSDIKKEKKTKKFRKRWNRFRKGFKNLKKRGKKFFEKVTNPRRYGDIAMWTYLGGVILGLLAGTSVIASTLGTILGVVSLIAAIIGVTGGDEDPRRARVMLIIHIVSTILAILLIFAFLALI